MLPEIPPGTVPVLLGGLAAEDIPPPIVHEVSEGQEGDFVEGHVHQEVDVSLVIIVYLIQQTHLEQMLWGGHTQGQNVSDRLMEA